MIKEETLRKNIIDAAKKQRWHNYEPENWFHCSGAGTCRRQLWNGKKGLSDFSDKSVMSMAVGTIIHEWLEESLELDGIRHEVDVAKQYGDITVVGTADMYDDDTVYDFKTIRALWYLPRVDKNVKSSPQTYYDHHVPQLNMYANILGKENICVVYVDKGTMDIKMFPMKADQKVVEDAVKKFDDVFHALGHKENPFDFCGCFVCDEEKRKLEKKQDNDTWKRV